MLEEKEESYNELLNDFEQYSKQVDEKMVEFETLNSLQNEIHNIKEEFNNKIKLLDEKNQLVKQHEDEIDSLNNDINNMKLEISNQQRVEELINEMSYFKNYIKELEKVSHTKLSLEKQKNQMLSDKSDKQANTIESLLASIQQLKTSNHESESANQAKITQLETELRERDQEINHLNKERENHVLVSQEDFDSFHVIIEHSKQVEAQLDQLQHQYQTLETDAHETKHRLNADLDQARQHNDDLQSQIDRILQENDDMRERLSRVHFIVQDTPRKTLSKGIIDALTPMKTPLNYLRSNFINGSGTSVGNGSVNGSVHGSSFSGSVTPLPSTTAATGNNSNFVVSTNATASNSPRTSENLEMKFNSNLDIDDTHNVPSSISTESFDEHNLHDIEEEQEDNEKLDEQQLQLQQQQYQNHVIHNTQNQEIIKDDDEEDGKIFNKNTNHIYHHEEDDHEDDNQYQHQEYQQEQGDEEEYDHEDDHEDNQQQQQQYDQEYVHHDEQQQQEEGEDDDFFRDDDHNFLEVEELENYQDHEYFDDDGDNKNYENQEQHNNNLRNQILNDEEGDYIIKSTIQEIMKK